MISSFIRNSIALTNSVSEIASVAHHPAVFFTQSGTDSENAAGASVTIEMEKTNIKINFIMYEYYILYYILVITKFIR